MASRWRRSGLVAAVLSGLAVATAPPAAAADVVIDCDTEGDYYRLFHVVSGVPFDDEHFFLLVWEGPGDRDFTLNGFPTSLLDPPVGFRLDEFPVHISFAAYRNTSGGDANWDPEHDETLYRGDVTVTACERTPMSAK